jgi:NAD(P)-dependent dehydrogenase (short-subunit alcohol dehydrogenase family)
MRPLRRLTAVRRALLRTVRRVWGVCNIAGFALRRVLVSGFEPAEGTMNVLDKFRLDDKVVIGTGASAGLGVAFAETCSQAGADVVLAARRVQKLSQTAELVKSAGRRAFTFATDVTEPEQCQAMVDAAVAEYGHVDVLVNNAGVGTAVPATRETPEEFRAVVDINLHGSYWAAQACARVMKPGSSIVNISSALGLTTAGLP